MNRAQKLFVFLVSPGLLLFFLCMKCAVPGAYGRAVQEDSFLESAQALFYFFASVLFFLVSTRFLKHKRPWHGLLFFALAIGLLLASLEEISWGQRIFGLANPDYFKQHNVQGELSLHNLDTVQPFLNRIYVLAGGYGAFAWIWASCTRAPRDRVLDFMVPDWFLSSYFVFCFLFYATAEWWMKPQTGGFFVWRDQEPPEMLMSLGFLLFAWISHRKSKAFLPARPPRL